MLFGFSSINSARISFSLIALELGASPSTVGLLVGTFYAFPVLLSWPVGRYSDRVGSRWMLLLGAGFGIGAMLIPYFMREIAALFLAAALMGIAFTLYNVLLPNLVGLLSSPHEGVRNFSNSSLVGGFSMVIGPLMAGIAIDFAPHGTASLYLALLSVVVVALLLRWGATLPGVAPRTTSAGTSSIGTLKDREMVRVLATSSLVQVGQDLSVLHPGPRRHDRVVGVGDRRGAGDLRGGVVRRAARHAQPRRATGRRPGAGVFVLLRGNGVHPRAVLR